MDEATLQRWRDDPLAFIDDLQISVGGKLCRFGDVMTPYQRTRFTSLMAAMQAVSLGHTPAVPNVWLEETKGNGKDHAAACALLWLLIFTPRILFCQAAAADQDQAGELRRAALQIVQLNQWIGEVVDIQAKAFVNEDTGSRCDIIPADEKGSHGALPDALLLNEASCVTKREFAENLLDNATKNPQGAVIIATNAGLTGSWQHQWREIAMNSPRWAFHRFAEPAPWLSPEAIDEARRRNTETRFLRLFRGVWSSGGGDAIDEADIVQCVTLKDPYWSRSANWHTFAGLDIGIKHDFSAMTCVAVNPYTGQARLAHCRTWSPAMHGGRVQLDVVEREVIEIWDRLKLHCCVFDPYQCEYMSQRLQSQGCKMIELPFSAKTHDIMAKKLLTIFRNHEIELYNDTHLIKDICSISLIERPNNTYKLVSPRTTSNGHSDLGTTFCMCAANIDTFKTDLCGLINEAGHDAPGGGRNLSQRSLTPWLDQPGNTSGWGARVANTGKNFDDVDGPRLSSSNTLLPQLW